MVKRLKKTGKKMRKPAAKRSVKKSRRGVKARTKPKARRAKRPKEGPVAGAVSAMMDGIKESADLRSRLAGGRTFED